jgi:sirohydrochlorin cobaltochelatase
MQQPNQQTSTHALILIGHGSLRSASGASMIRIAARLRERKVAPRVEAAFLNYSRPTLAEVVSKVHAAGATTITIQPYFLIAGFYVQNDLHALIAEVGRDYPSVSFRLAPALGDHPALIGLAQRRVQVVLDGLDATDSPLTAPSLLLMAHGTPLPTANAPLYTIADALVKQLGLAGSLVSYLDCNTPTIPDAFDQLVAGGAQQIIALPYFLHLGRHVAEDLPALVAQAKAKHVNTSLLLAQHLDYDVCLVDAVEGLLPAAQLVIQRQALALS